MDIYLPLSLFLTMRGRIALVEGAKVAATVVHEHVWDGYIGKIELAMHSSVC